MSADVPFAHGAVGSCVMVIRRRRRQFHGIGLHTQIGDVRYLRSTWCLGPAQLLLEQDGFVLDVFHLGLGGDQFGGRFLVESFELFGRFAGQFRLTPQGVELVLHRIQLAEILFRGAAVVLAVQLKTSKHLVTCRPCQNWSVNLINYPILLLDFDLSTEDKTLEDDFFTAAAFLVAEWPYGVAVVLWLPKLVLTPTEEAKEEAAGCGFSSTFLASCSFNLLISSSSLQFSALDLARFFSSISSSCLVDCKSSRTLSMSS